MQMFRKIAFSSLLIFSASPIVPTTVMASTLPITQEKVLIARVPSQAGRWIWQGGKWLFRTIGGAVIAGGANKATASTIETMRYNQLIERVHQQEYLYYQQYGTPIPVNEYNVAWVMHYVGARPSERNIVIQRMYLYW